MLSRTGSIRGAVMLLVVALGSGILASDERSPEVFLQLGDLLVEESRYHEAVDAYGRARTSTDREIAYRASTGLVRALLRTADFSRARREAGAGADAYPQSADLLAMHGDSLWATGLFPEAERRYRDTLALDPKHARAHHGMARVLTVSRSFAAALDQVRAAIDYDPTEAEFHHTEGYIHERRGEFAESAEALRRFQNLLPPRDREERSLLSRAQIRFLESFEGRTPYAIDPADAGRVHTVPFRLVRDKVVVVGRVNGGRELEFVLDTGAEMTVIGRRTAERHGIAPLGFTMSAGVGEAGLRGLQLGRLDQLSIGTFRMKDVPVLIKSPALRGLPTREGESWSPVALGLSAIIDYGKRTITFGKMRLEPGELEMPMYLYRLAMVRGTVNGKEPASFIVDTGGEVISISMSMASAIGPSRTRRIPLKVYGSSGWDRDAFLYPGLDLAFDRIRFDNFATVVLNLRAPSLLLGIDLGGIVGHRFLSRYRVGIDVEAGLLKLSQLPGGSALPRGVLPAASALPPPSDALPRSPE
jgi:predicted aspartyl protease/Flp pilus assembly protein TadD